MFPEPYTPEADSGVVYARCVEFETPTGEVDVRFYVVNQYMRRQVRIESSEVRTPAALLGTCLELTDVPWVKRHHIRALICAATGYFGFQQEAPNRSPLRLVPRIARNPQSNAEKD